jgi:DNA polymerase (family X)
MDNLAIARVLAEVADLLEIRNENPFKVRAYRNAADVVAHHPCSVAGLGTADLRALPGIGKDLAARIVELVGSGTMRYHQELLQEFPPTILDLLNLPGVGPKTVALLHHQLGIRTLDDLERAAREGRLRVMKGMGAKKEAAILRALEERTRVAGRRLIADAHDTASALLEALRARAPGATIVAVGSLRRGADTCGDLDILAAGAPPSIVEAFREYRLVERVLAHGDTKTSVRLWGGLQTDLRVVPAKSAGAAMQYFTGSKSHNIALRDRAIARGFELNEYGLFRAGTDEAIAGDTEEGLYEALGLAWIPPELREGRGEIAAAGAGTLPHLVELGDVAGDVHMHTTASDGRTDALTMARAAHAAGLGYVAITDHSRALSMANGLDEHRALAHARAVRALNGRDDLAGLTVLAGIECDILPDGRMDLSEDCLAALDIVIASVHAALNQDEAAMTDRLLRAIACPWVDVMAHPTGRLLLKRDPVRATMDRVFAAAAEAGVALEINGQPHRRDLDDTLARRARDLGVELVASSDAHSPAALGNLRWGVLTARRAWLTRDDLLNTRPVDHFRASLRRARKQP